MRRLQNRHLRWIRAFQNLSDIFSGLAVHPTDALAVAQEAARYGELAHEAHSRELVPVGERDDLLTPIQHDRIGRSDQYMGLGTQQLLERDLEFAAVLGIDRDGLQA